MNRIQAARTRVAFASVAAAGLALLAAAVPASAAGGTPTTPTDLYNDYQACSTDQSKPVNVAGRSGLTVEGIPGHADPGVQNVTAQYQAWPVSDPSHIVTAARTYALVGDEATGTLGGFEAPLLDGETE
jgi:hypothetical protein